MKHKVVAPSVGESITEVSILKWAKADGDAVKTGETILEIESDKATVEVVAEANGALKILKQEGETVPIGEQIGEIDDSVAGNASAGASAAAAPTPSAPAPAAQAAPSSPTPASAPARSVPADAPLSPAVQKMVTENNLNPSQISGTGLGGRLTKGDVMNHMAGGASSAPAAASKPATPAGPTPGLTDEPGARRVPMTRLRQTIARRLMEAQQGAALLTTFNEADMSPIMNVRKQYKEAFKAKHGVALSFMSFFTRACVEVLKQIPAVNAYIDGKDIIFHDYIHMGIAVGTDRGLVVPVMRNAHQMSFLDIEKSMAEMAGKARSGKLGIKDMSGGTFTISNGGTYGSMMSTPIINPPQSGILGMHNIIERPMAVDGQVVVRPMMYLALSYDHRMIDGKEAVTFLVSLKDYLEHPEKLGTDYANGL